MKKFAILTSILALTACGGGHGSGDTPRLDTVMYVDPVEESNSNVTGMVSNSEYQVARYVANKLGEDATSVNLSRSAFTPKPSTGNTDYDKARELVDLAAWLADDTTTENDIISMFNNSKIDKNKIKAALKLMDDMYCFVGGSAEKTAERIISRRADFQAPLADLQQKTEVFNLKDVDFTMADEGFGGNMKFDVDEKTGEVTKFIMLADEEDDTDLVFNRIGKSNKFSGKVNHEGWQKAKLTYDSLGKELGLRYCDFGGFDIDVIDGWRPVFIGGYDTKKIEPRNIVKSETFTGKATGSVVSILDGEGSGRALPLDANAQLTFDNNTGASELIAKFNNWYDVKYTENGDNKSIVLKNYTNSDTDFRMLRDTGSGVTISNADGVQHEYNFENHIPVDEFSTIESLHASADDEELNFINSDIRYFGNNNIPVEAVGIVQVRECADNRCGDVITGIDTSRPDNQIDMRRNDEIRVNLGFGVKK